MSTNKAIGTSFESKVVKLFEEAGFETCRRVVLHGANDEGDLHIGNHPNDPDIIVECKSRKTEVAYKGVEDFIKEAHTEYYNAKKDTSIINTYCALVAIKRPNLGAQDGYLVWKNKYAITVRARIGDILNKDNFIDCKNENERVERLEQLLSNI